MRDLTVRENGSKEFNYLQVLNLDEFLNDYVNNFDTYISPFKILAELEAEIMFENNPDECILIPYKDDGDIIFQLIEIKEGERSPLRIVVYAFNGLIS